MKRGTDEPSRNPFPVNPLVGNQLTQDLTRLWDMLAHEAQEIFGPVGQMAFDPFQVERRDAASWSARSSCSVRAFRWRLLFLEFGKHRFARPLPVATA